MDEAWAAAVHEAGHALVGAALGWRPVHLTIRPDGSGRCSYLWPVVDAAVSSRIDPQHPGAFLTWPSEVRSFVEADLCSTLAGPIAEYMYAKTPAGRVPDLGTGPHGNCELPGLPQPSGEDADRIEYLLTIAHGTDLASAVTWSVYVGAQAKRLLREGQDRLLVLAQELAEAEDGTLDAGSLTGLLAERP